MANSFSYLELHTPDAARAKPFYTELFGWKTRDTPAPNIGTYTEIDTEEGLPGGMLPQQPGGPSGWLVYVSVANLDATIARAQKLGASIAVPRMDIKEGSFAVLQDPAGSRIGVFQKAG